ncbi:MAG: hypothetical protein M3020_13055, partial [Myxococcota bacterium]|nr:hypothetical protein [Myxococcota bacterium]
ALTPPVAAPPVGLLEPPVAPPVALAEPPVATPPLPADLPPVGVEPPVACCPPEPPAPGSVSELQAESSARAAIQLEHRRRARLGVDMYS